MTDWTVTGMAKNHQGRPRDRLSSYLDLMFPGVGRDKRLAAELRISPRAARNLFAGHWPGDETWAAIVRRFGADVLRVVFSPEIDPIAAELAEKERRLDRELQALRARRRAVEGLVPSDPHRREGDRREAAAPLDGPPNGDLFEGVGR